MKKIIFYLASTFLTVLLHSAGAAEIDARNPMMISDSAGNKIVVWRAVDTESSKHVIQAITYTAEEEWSKPVSISDSAQDAMEPKLAIDSGGNVVVTWIGMDTVSGSAGLHVASIRGVQKGSWGNWNPSVLVSINHENVSPEYILTYDKKTKFSLHWTAVLSGYTWTTMRMSSSKTFDGAWSTPFSLSQE